ncbi:uncharacterized protein (TIGR00255 family) [Geomicrobium halophilum]|uniref:Uncharacterized protein (TIGR00255 family) n=1 Tax=Geomicrobium halophilum TaxID=549000 RepID=A0A841PNK4_9BACL|nr:YicC/YloC family endoribonuclease [Geomicrobium halophilum]MBB6449354.1 uncharacterized protein (TIGR00255 family) [Geomicrobium halophilum]
MVTSMTGYGYAEETYGKERVSVEIKSVNHRFLDVSFHLPATLRRLEEEARKIVSERALRGKVDITVTLSGGAGVERNLQTDWALLDQYLQEAEQFKALGVFDEKLLLKDFLFNPNIVSIQEEASENTDAFHAFIKAMKNASLKLTDMKKQEGRLLFQDLQKHFEDISLLLQNLDKYIPEAQRRYQERLEKRIRAFLGTVDEERLLTEVAIFAEKSDITEELVRLRSHLQQFNETLHDTGIIGRKLDFLTQEMNREVNTIGSKGNDQEVSKCVVEIKSMLEKVKEQVQNIE